MNPSQDNSFGSFGTGGISSGNFGGGQMPAAPIGSGSDDIILNNGTAEKKSKKGLIIAVVLVALVLIVGLGFFVWNRINSSGGNGAVSSSTKDKFNRYANFFLYGEDKDTPIGAEFSEEYNSEFKKIINEDGEDNTSYLDNLRKLFEDFYGSYSGSLDENDSQLFYLNEYKDKFNLVTNYYGGVNALTEYEITKEYLSNGEQSVKEMIDDRLSVYEEIGDIYGVKFYNIAHERAAAILSFIQESQQLGCVDDDEVDYGCVDSLNNTEIKNLNDEIDRGRSTMEAIINNSFQSVYSGIFYYNSIINNNEEDLTNE